MRFLLSFIACVSLLRLTLCFVALRASLHPLRDFAFLVRSTHSPEERKFAKEERFCDRFDLCTSITHIPQKQERLHLKESWAITASLAPSLSGFRFIQERCFLWRVRGFGSSPRRGFRLFPWFTSSRQRTLFLRGESLAKEEANLFAIKMINLLFFFVWNF